MPRRAQPGYSFRQEGDGAALALREILIQIFGKYSKISSGFALRFRCLHRRGKCFEISDRQLFALFELEDVMIA